MADGLISIIGGKLTTYRNLAEQTVDRVAKLLHLRLPDCRTHETMLPGATGIEQAGKSLRDLQLLSEAGVTRLLAVYGGRAADIAELCAGDKKLAVTLDAERSVLAGEVLFAIRYEFAKTLSDIVFRRLMIGLDADQGRPLYNVIAELAATELGWSGEVVARELRDLNDFSDSLRVS